MRRACGGQEVRDGLGLRYYRAGASRRGQAYGDDGSNGTDEDFSDHENSPVDSVFTLMMFTIQLACERRAAHHLGQRFMLLMVRRPTGIQ